MLLPIEHIIHPEDAKRLQHTIESEHWVDGKRTAGSLASHVKANLQLDEQSDIAQQLGQVISDAVLKHPLFISAALPKTLFPPRFNCYQNGGHYGLHVDNALMNLANGQVMRTDLSATLFLNDADEYAGGELSIETQYGTQDIKMNAGDLVLYPSTSLHQVMPVTTGKRLAAFFWVQSLVPNSTQREQLFELDQSIQILTQERGSDDHEVRRLSGLYHNLLRGWSEV